MKSRMKVLGAFAAACMLTAPVAFGGTITGSAHDFSTQTWGGGQICLACHAPHNNLSTTGLLWNHTESTATYTVYASPTMSSTPTQPAGTSKLCMSCHDGTIAVDSYGGATGGTLITSIDPNLSFGTSLGNDHPISFPYVTTGGEEVYPTTTAVTFGDGSTGTIADMLDAGSVQCQSCHDVHNTKAAANTPLLLKANTNSALCLTCHTK